MTQSNSENNNNNGNGKKVEFLKNIIYFVIIITSVIMAYATLKERIRVIEIDAEQQKQVTKENVLDIKTELKCISSKLDIMNERLNEVYYSKTKKDNQIDGGK